MENYYHIYNRGAHKAPIFNDQGDYWRFLGLLYISNSAIPFQFSNLSKRNIFSIERISLLVEVISYCLMPNHFHIYVKEIQTGGITKFMRKLSTSYTMYFNLKYTHSGTIFQGKYKSKPVTDEVYSETLINYIHLNPFGILEPNIIRDCKKEYLNEAYKYAQKYEYSSLKDYLGEIRPQKIILSIGSTSKRSDLIFQESPERQHK